MTNNDLRKAHRILIAAKSVSDLERVFPSLPRSIRRLVVAMAEAESQLQESFAAHGEKCTKCRPEKLCERADKIAADFAAKVVSLVPSMVNRSERRKNARRTKLPTDPKTPHRRSATKSCRRGT